MVAGGQNTEELRVLIGKLKAQKRDKLTKYQRDLLDWYENVDQKYAWVVLIALFLVMCGALGPYRIYGYVFATIVTQGVYTREEASWPVSAIYTVENCLGPLVSIIAYHISIRKSLLIGGILFTASNSLTTISNSLVMDVLLLGCIQGVGLAFIFMPLMGIVNSYFLRYRNLAFGFVLCGGTLSIFPLAPIFQWILIVYPWRYAYLGIGIFSTIIILMVPLLRPNPQPMPSSCATTDPAPNSPVGGHSTLARMSFQALSYQSSVRRQSTAIIALQAGGSSHRASEISVSPFASSVGLERKLSRAIMDSQAVSAVGKQPPTASSPPRADGLETASTAEVGNEGSDVDLSAILDVLKTPAFHLIWFSDVIYYWIFSIYCLVLVDYGVDRGCTLSEAENLLSYQSIGELVGRLVLTAIVDMHFLSNKNTVVLILLILAGILVAITQIAGFIALATLTVAMNAFLSLVYILLNGLLVDYLGERKVTLGYGMASCIAGVLMFFRPHAVGYFRDTQGTYEPLMLCLAASCALCAVLWLIEPLVTRMVDRRKSSTEVAVNGAGERSNV